MQVHFHMGMTNIISEMAVFHANRSMKTNFARKFVIFHWVKQQKTISSPNVDTINICPGARRKISYVTWETIKSSIECLFCLFCWVKFVFWSVENSPKLPLGQLKVLHAKHFFLNLHKCHPKMQNLCFNFCCKCMISEILRAPIVLR